VVSRFIHHAYRRPCVYLYSSAGLLESKSKCACTYSGGGGAGAWVKPKCEIWPGSTYSLLFSPARALKHNTSAGELGQINYLKPRLYWLSALILRSLPLSHARVPRASECFSTCISRHTINSAKLWPQEKETLLELAPSLNNVLTFVRVLLTLVWKSRGVFATRFLRIFFAWFMPGVKVFEQRKDLSPYKMWMRSSRGSQSFKENEYKIDWCLEMYYIISIASNMSQTKFTNRLM